MMDRAEAIVWLTQYVENGYCREAFKDALETAIAALREQESLESNSKTLEIRWISVKEPPEPFVDVQCYCPNKDYGSKIVVSYNEVRNGPAYFADQHWCGKVTHWMPLPEPPEEGAEG